MSQNLFSLKKKKRENNKENKIKDDEEMSNDIQSAIEIISMNYYGNIDYMVEGMKIANSHIER